jgi:endonuclease/exonuclease/phosphatase (EEP) superfamily protein YafD
MPDHTPSTTSEPHPNVAFIPQHSRLRPARFAASFLLLAAFACTVASLPARSWWVADVFANLRIQACLATAVFMTACALLRLKNHAFLASLLFLWHASFLTSAFVPTTAAQHSSPPTDPRSPPPTAGFSICIANVRFDNPRHNIIADSLRGSRADVLVVIEVNHRLRKSLTQQLRANYPHMVWADREPGSFGIGVLSRLPLVHPRIQDFGFLKSDDQSLNLPTITTEISTSAGKVHLIALHCMPPIGQNSFRLRSRQLETAAKAAADLPPDSHILLAGDFNLTPWAPAFQDLINHSKLLSSAAGHGIEPTWNAGPRYPCGLLIDHILHSPNLACLERLILPSLHSDHRPVLARFRISDPALQHDSAAPSASHPYSPDPQLGTTP